MATTPLRNPYDTRVLPAVPLIAPRPPTSVLPASPLLPGRPAPAQAPATTPAARRRLVVALQGHGQLAIWDDRVVTHEQVFALDDTFSARVTTDWRAPLTVEAPLGLALRDHRGRWNIYVPEDEEQVWLAASVLRDACTARGLDLPHLDPPEPDDGAALGDLPLWRFEHPAAPPPAPPAPAARPAPRFASASEPVRHPVTRTLASAQVRPSAEPAVARATGQRLTTALATPAASAPSLTSDTVLLAITHLSVVFLPVVLPLTVWLALRQSVPAVARQARQVAAFQAVVAVLGTLLLGFAVHGALTHAGTAAAIGLAGFVALLAAAAVCAFYVALRAMRGDTFGYLDLLQAFRRG